jgi:Uncharacterized protein conserved in bacteria (DUF2321)
MARVEVGADRPERSGRRRCDLVVVCHQGHVQAWKPRGIERWVHPRGLWTRRRPQHCRYCGAPVIDACGVCSKGIAARRTHVESDDWKVDSFCGWCGASFPWTPVEEPGEVPSVEPSDERQDRVAERARRAGRGVGRFLLTEVEELIRVLIRRKFGLPPT